MDRWVYTLGAACGRVFKLPPFFTGTQNIIDTAGQVERFQKRLERQVRG